MRQHARRIPTAMLPERRRLAAVPSRFANQRSPADGTKDAVATGFGTDRSFGKGSSGSRAEEANLILHVASGAHAARSLTRAGGRTVQLARHGLRDRSPCGRGSPRSGGVRGAAGTTVPDKSAPHPNPRPKRAMLRSCPWHASRCARGEVAHRVRGTAVPNRDQAYSIIKALQPDAHEFDRFVWVIQLHAPWYCRRRAYDSGRREGARDI